MSLQSLPHVLTSLTEREAITDALYRALLAFDNNDVSMFNSAFSEDVIVEYRGSDINGRDAIRTQFLDVVGTMDTTHTISNVRVNVKDGASTASLTAYAQAQHCPAGKGGEPDSPKYLVASTYFVDLEKVESEGLWKIKKWAAKVIWRQGDSSVMQRHS